MPALSFDWGSIDWSLTLVAGRAVFLVFCFLLAAVAFTRWRRAADGNAAQVAEQTARVLERLAEIDARITEANAQLAELAERVALLNTSASSNAASPSYAIAIRMARSGATREELMANCALTRQEAELVQRLHTPPRERLAAVG